MRTQQKRWITLFLALALLALATLPVVAALPAAAADAVPQAVLDARQGVVRIVAIYSDGFGMGTGFCVGTQEEYYVVTNHHVIEDAPEIRIYYDTGKYVAAEVKKDVPGRDLCVLAPAKAIRGAVVLPLQTQPFDIGISAYALGYPGAADVMSGDWESYGNGSTQFVADKQTMTVTDGIVSALRSNNYVGDGSRTVETIQHNVAISGGNSGGPLLNADGVVIGVNTLSGIDTRTGGVAEGMHAAVHVDELVDVLKSARIKFDEPQEAVSGWVPPARESGVSPVVVTLIFVGAVLLVGGAAVVLVLRKQKRPKVKGGKTLAEFERGYGRLEEVATLEMTKELLAKLVQMPAAGLGSLLTPENVMIGDKEIALAQTGAKQSAATRLEIYPGYSAPENYQGQAGPAASVYFVGAMLYTLLSGQRPPEALQRQQKNAPAFPQASRTMQKLVNQAMEPYDYNRVADLAALLRLMNSVSQAVYAENGYAPAAGSGYYPR